MYYKVEEKFTLNWETRIEIYEYYNCFSSKFFYISISRTYFVTRFECKTKTLKMYYTKVITVTLTMKVIYSI